MLCVWFWYQCILSIYKGFECVWGMLRCCMVFQVCFGVNFDSQEIPSSSVCLSVSHSTSSFTRQTMQIKICYTRLKLTKFWLPLHSLSELGNATHPHKRQGQQVLHVFLQAATYHLHLCSLPCCLAFHFWRGREWVTRVMDGAGSPIVMREFQKDL